MCVFQFKSELYTCSYRLSVPNKVTTVDADAETHLILTLEGGRGCAGMVCLLKVVVEGSGNGASPAFKRRRIMRNVKLGFDVNRSVDPLNVFLICELKSLF